MNVILPGMSALQLSELVTIENSNSPRRFDVRKTISNELLHEGNLRYLGFSLNENLTNQTHFIYFVPNLFHNSENECVFCFISPNRILTSDRYICIFGLYVFVSIFGIWLQHSRSLVKKIVLHFSIHNLRQLPWTPGIGVSTGRKFPKKCSKLLFANCRLLTLFGNITRRHSCTWRWRHLSRYW